MRIAITGARGFVGPYVAKALTRLSGVHAEIIATAKEGGQHPMLGSVLPLDVTDGAAVAALIRDARPSHVVHLAGIAAVAESNADPDTTWRVHLHGTLNLARAILRHCPACWLLNIGSGLVYGESAKSGLPLDETTLLAPTDEYSASKAAADLALGAFAPRGLKCVRLRPFNHSGPGQSEAFVIPSFAMQIARIEAGLAPPVIRVGHLDSERDFLDVRDVADAYALVIAKSESIAAGTALNIASRVPRRIGDILKALLELSTKKITIVSDQTRMRSTDTPRFIGSAERAKALLGWSPRFKFDDTLADVLRHCRCLVSDEPQRYTLNSENRGH
ncbi:MAG TPA: GDP-mannose 4,6-dehydratase [Steroidobacteraceae bacterium]|nr:GDP-mannose 4,6-dehydratase [Steroidobacteraceae bacterium]